MASQKLLEPSADRSRTISIIGTGDYGRALGKRLIQHGYTVVYGSRNPAGRNLGAIDETLTGVAMMTISDCVHMGDIVVVAIHTEAYKKTFEPLAAAMVGKIVIEISNPTKIKKETELSNAETLQEMFPHISVVKCFNTVSAYTLLNGYSSGTTEVHICGNDDSSRMKVMLMTRELGFVPVDKGRLQAAREVEAMPLRLFSGWGAPTLVSGLVFLLWYAIMIGLYHFLKGFPWSRLPVNITNKAFGCTSISLLALCYLPGSIACIFQLVYGTKHKRFPNWLDHWLIMRKQLGIFSFLLACMHTCTSLSMLSPAYLSRFYPAASLLTIPPNLSTTYYLSVPNQIMNLRGELMILLGTFAMTMMAILALTSLPAVGNLLNWREWVFIQSYLGFALLFVATGHVWSSGIPEWFQNGFLTTIKETAFLGMLLPVIVLFLRVLFLMPCFSIPLWKIRRGWERGAKYDTKKSGAPQQPASQQQRVPDTAIEMEPQSHASKQRVSPQPPTNISAQPQNYGNLRT